MRTGQLAGLHTVGELKLSDIRLDILWNHLFSRRLVSDKAFEVLVYRTASTNEPYGIIDDVDLQNAINHFHQRAEPSMLIMVLTPDDFG